MLDACTFVAGDLLPEEMAAIGRSEAFAGCDGEPDKFGWIRANHKGLTLMLSTERAKLKVKGSLPTFANGNNLELLTYAQMQRTLPAFAAAVGLPMNRLVIVGGELSVDIEPSTSPQSYLETLQHHKHSKFCMVLPSSTSARPLEYVAVHTEFNLKLYNKNKWAKQLGLPVLAGHHKLRYEIVMKQARAINALWNRSQTTLADLLSPEFYAAAAAELEQRWKEIVREQPLDFTGLKKYDRLLLAAGYKAEYWRGLKADSPLVTYKRTRKRHRELVEGSRKRVGLNEYDQRLPLALAALLPPVATSQNDTFLHTFSPVEISPLRIERAAAAPSLVNDASGGDGASGGGLPASSPCQPDDDEREPTTTAARRCHTCDRILTSTSSRAKFCSELEWDKLGKRCRNAASNPLHNTLRAVKRILSQSTLFDQRPYLRIPEPIRAAVLAAAA